MAAVQTRKSRRRRPAHGSVLLLVLVVVAMLTLGTAAYLDLMQTEQRAVRFHGRATRALRLAESGVEYAKGLLALPAAELAPQGGLSSNPTRMQAVVVDDPSDEFDRGLVTIVSPAQVDGRYSGIRYGLENESAKLHVNSLLAPDADDQAAGRLLALPGMTAEIADAILDWLDKDETPRNNGAEAEHYGQLSPTYKPRNGLIPSIDELLLVRGVTPELLYGLDQNRNFAVDAAEKPRGLLTEIDNGSGEMNLGWAAYLTVTSVEATRSVDGTPLVDLNAQNLQQLYNDLKAAGLDDAQAKFIIVYRQYGPQQPPGEANGAAGGANGGTGATSAGGPANVTAPSGQSTPPNTASAQLPQQTIAAGNITLKFEQQGGTSLNSPIDLVAVKVQVPGATENDPAQLVDSPWQDDMTSYRNLLKLYDAASVGAARRVAGRVNVNVATRPVLRSLPGLSAMAIDQIVSRREAEPDLAMGEQRHAVWLLVEGIVKLDEMRTLERYVTTRGDVFSGQSVGYFAAGAMAARGEFIVDRSGTSPRIRAWRDLSSLGRGFAASTLGVDDQATP